MLRHLPRYTRGLDSALRADRLTRADLALLAPYLPNLGTAWMSAAAMTARDTGEDATVGAPNPNPNPNPNHGGRATAPLGLCAPLPALRAPVLHVPLLSALSARRPKRLTRW